MRPPSVVLIGSISDSRPDPGIDFVKLGAACSFWLVQKAKHARKRTPALGPESSGATSVSLRPEVLMPDRCLPASSRRLSGVGKDDGLWLGSPADCALALCRRLCKSTSSCQTVWSHSKRGEDEGRERAGHIGIIAVAVAAWPQDGKRVRSGNSGASTSASRTDLHSIVLPLARLLLLALLLLPLHSLPLSDCRFSASFNLDKRGLPVARTRLCPRTRFLPSDLCTCSVSPEIPGPLVGLAGTEGRLHVPRERPATV